MLYYKGVGLVRRTLSPRKGIVGGRVPLRTNCGEYNTEAVGERFGGKLNTHEASLFQNSRKKTSR